VTVCKLYLKIKVSLVFVFLFGLTNSGHPAVCIHDSIDGPSRLLWSNHACATEFDPYSDPITCTCTRLQD